LLVRVMGSLRFSCVLSAGVHDNAGKIAETGQERKYRLPLDLIAGGYGVVY